MVQAAADVDTLVDGLDTLGVDITTADPTGQNVIIFVAIVAAVGASVSAAFKVKKLFQ